MPGRKITVTAATVRMTEESSLLAEASVRVSSATAILSVVDFWLMRLKSWEVLESHTLFEESRHINLFPCAGKVYDLGWHAATYTLLTIAWGGERAVTTYRGKLYACTTGEVCKLDLLHF